MGVVGLVGVVVDCPPPDEFPLLFPLLLLPLVLPPEGVVLPGLPLPEPDEPEPVESVELFSTGVVGLSSSGCFSSCFGGVVTLLQDSVGRAEARKTSLYVLDPPDKASAPVP